MKSFIFGTSYVQKDNHESHLQRYEKWVEWYLPLLEKFDADNLFLVDDASDLHEFTGCRLIDSIHEAENLPASFTQPFNMVRHGHHLGRNSDLNYAGWWRSFTSVIDLAEKYGFDKIIHIESDFFILSDRLVEYLKNLRSGWVGLFSDFYEFPETAIQVICRDCFQQFKDLRDFARANNYQFTDTAESMIPFSELNKTFTGDRFGELQILKYWAPFIEDDSILDYSGNVPTYIKPLSAIELKQTLLHLKQMSLSNQEISFDYIIEYMNDAGFILPGYGKQIIQ